MVGNALKRNAEVLELRLLYVPNDDTEVHRKSEAVARIMEDAFTALNTYATVSYKHHWTAEGAFMKVFAWKFTPVMEGA